MGGLAGAGRGGRLALAVALVGAGAVGCGVPQDSTVRVVDRARVPYDLLGAGPAATSGPEATRDELGVPQVFLLDAAERPVPQPQEVDAVGVSAVLTELLERLAAGPTDEDRAQGLSSALGAGVRLELLDVTDRVARLSLRASDQPLPADRIPLAIGQIVFTATSVDGIDRVQLVRRGRPIEVPLPGGARASGPVGASDYLRLLTDPPGPSATATGDVSP